MTKSFTSRAINVLLLAFMPFTTKKTQLNTKLFLTLALKPCQWSESISSVQKIGNWHARVKTRTHIASGEVNWAQILTLTPIHYKRRHFRTLDGSNTNTNAKWLDTFIGTSRATGIRLVIDIPAWRNSWCYHITATKRAGDAVPSLNKQVMTSRC